MIRVIIGCHYRLLLAPHKFVIMHVRVSVSHYKLCWLLALQTFIVGGILPMLRAQLFDNSLLYLFVSRLSL